MKIIRLRKVLENTGLGRSTLYKLVGEGKFPPSIRLGERTVGWVEEEVENWIKARVNARDTAQKLHPVN